MKRKMTEYEEIKRQIEVLNEEVKENGLQNLVESEIGEMGERSILK